jgi:hypothetical protein
MGEKLKTLEKLLSPFAGLLRGMTMGPAERECDIFLCGEMGEEVSFLKYKSEPPTVASE